MYKNIATIQGLRYKEGQELDLITIKVYALDSGGYEAQIGTNIECYTCDNFEDLSEKIAIFLEDNWQEDYQIFVSTYHKNNLKSDKVMIEWYEIESFLNRSKVGLFLRRQDKKRSRSGISEIN